MKKIYILMIFLNAVTSTEAQDSINEYKWWVTLGLGMYEETISTNLNYSFSVGDNFYKVGYLHKGGVLGGVGGDGLESTSIDISIGKTIQSEWFQASLFCGPSYVFGKKSIGSGNYENFNTVGLESNVQLLFRPENAIGIGFGVYGNLNFVKSYVGININLILGNGN